MCVIEWETLEIHYNVTRSASNIFRERTTRFILRAVAPVSLHKTPPHLNSAHAHAHATTSPVFHFRDTIRGNSGDHKAVVMRKSANAKGIGALEERAQLEANEIIEKPTIT